MNKFIEYGKDLKERIKKFDYDYYVLSKPSISDFEYDRLYAEYEELEQQYPELKTPDSPTQRVGSEPLSKLEKFNHYSPLLSINQKAKSIEALKKFFKDCKGDKTSFLIQPKYDGLTVNLNYDNGLLVNAATRGNGYIGELITENVRTIKSVPLSIPFKGKLEVRGEAVISYQHFLETYSKEYSNPRNFASGTMRQLDPKLTAKRKPDIVFYDIGICDKQFKDDLQRLTFLKEQGFKVTPYVVVNNEKDLINTCTSYLNNNIKIKDGFNVLNTNTGVTDFVCDGLVVKVLDLKRREELGMTTKGPKWAFAYKFKSLKVDTTIRDIVFQVGRTGKITPVGVFDEVNIGGTKVTKATLNNIDYIKRLGATPPDIDKIIIDEDKGTVNFKYEGINKKVIFITKYYSCENHYVFEVETSDNDVILFPFRPELNLLFEKTNKFPDILFKETEIPASEFYLHIGDNITIERSNDVIPRIIGINYKERKNVKKIVFPTECPTCKTVLEEIYPLHYCTNIDCPDRLKGSIEHFAQRDAMNIIGFGTSIINLFVDNGYLTSIKDIYTLYQYKDEIMNLEGFGEKKVNNLLESIEKSKKSEFWRILYGLGIREVGQTMAKNLTKHFKSIENLINASYEDLKSVKDVGDTIAQEIRIFFSNKKNLELIDYLKSQGMSMENNEVPLNNIFDGKTFVITGTLKEKRNWYKEIIENNGGKVTNSVSKKTSVVIIGENAGSKEQKARALIEKGENIILIEGHEAFVEFLEQYK